MTTMNEIDAGAKKLSEARAKLAESVAALKQAMDALHRSHLPGIKRGLTPAFEAEQALRELVASAPGLFEKPKTVVLHGIKVGYQKGVGKVSWDDDDMVVRLIRKKLPDQADVLIKTEETPIKTALKQLNVKQLQSIGCEVEESGDVVVVRAIDSVIDKLVKALLKGLDDEATATAEVAEAAT